LWANGNISPCCTSYGRDASDISLAHIEDKDFLSKSISKRLELQEAFLDGDWANIPKSCRHCLSQSLKKKDIE